MNRTISLVQRVKIASPCSASWAEMSGNEQVRCCSYCRLNVYNLSSMTPEEGERLIVEKEGKLCARIYRRADGTVLTRDCPRGLRMLRQRAARHALRVAAAVAFISATALGAIAGIRRPMDAYGIEIESPDAYCQTMATLGRWLSSSGPTSGGGQWTQGFVIMVPPPPLQPTSAAPINSLAPLPVAPESR